ncbi:MAG: hypothetical protein WD316_12920 [Phycisphaeraceae bacterium]
MIGRGWHGLAAAAAVAVGLACQVAGAEVVDSTWTVPGSGDWYALDNWTGPVPDGAGHIARFGSYIGMSPWDRYDVRLDRDLTLGQLRYDGTDRPIRLESDDPDVPRTLTFQAGDDAAAMLSVESNDQHDITVDVELASPLHVSGDNGSAGYSGHVDFAGHFDNSQAHPLVVGGEHITLRFTGGQTWGASSTLLATDSARVVMGGMADDAPGHLGVEVTGQAQFKTSFAGRTALESLHLASDSAFHETGGTLVLNSPLRLKKGALGASGQIVGGIENGGGSLRTRLSGLHVDGDYVQHAGGLLNGTSFGPNLEPPGTLTVTGDVALDGTLLAPASFRGMYPAVGWSFPLLEALDGGLISGTFANIERQRLDDDAYWRIDYSDAAVRLTVSVVGDMNHDGNVDAADVSPFVLALTDPGGYEAIHGADPAVVGDVNGDGLHDAVDVSAFVALLVGSDVGGEPAGVPEPGVGALVTVLLLGLSRVRRRTPAC